MPCVRAKGHHTVLWQEHQCCHLCKSVAFGVGSLQSWYLLTAMALREGKVGRPRRKAAGECQAAPSASATAAAAPAAAPTVAPKSAPDLLVKAASAQRQDTIASSAAVARGNVSDVANMAPKAAPVPAAMLLQGGGTAGAPRRMRPVATTDEGLPQFIRQLTGADGQIAAPREPSPDMARFMAEVRQSVKAPERFRRGAEPFSADLPPHEAADTALPAAHTAQRQDSNVRSEPKPPGKRARHEPAAGGATGEAGGAQDVKRFRQEVHDKFPAEATSVASYLQTMSHTWLSRVRAVMAPKPQQAAATVTEPSPAAAEPCDIEMAAAEPAVPAAQPAAERMVASDDAPAASGAVVPVSMRPVDPSQEWWHQVRH